MNQNAMENEQAELNSGIDSVQRPVRPEWSRKAIHRNLGEVKITMECLAIQLRNTDPTSIFVEHDGEIKEISRAMIISLPNAKLTDRPN